jgi:diguanylate cyclase (GGDEF)-like protein
MHSKSIARVIDTLSRSSKECVFFLGVALIALFGSIDLLTRSEILFSIFYLIPITITSWFADRRRSVIVAVLSVAMLLVNDLHTHRVTWSSFILYWDAVSRGSSFLIISYALSALKHAFEREKELARTDALTGMANSRALYEVMDREMIRARRAGQPLTVAYMDIDNFKEINDTLGHAAGDHLLCMVAETIGKTVRGTDTVARVGGDEFVILLPDADYGESEEAVERIQADLLELMRTNDRDATFSIGMVTYRDMFCSVDEMVRTADKLMYRIKSNGKNGILHQTIVAGECRELNDGCYRAKLVV